jgi:hypothetical protein
MFCRSDPHDPDESAACDGLRLRAMKRRVANVTGAGGLNGREEDGSRDPIDP